MTARPPSEVRRELRRATLLDCGVISEWLHEPVPMLARNLSPRGMWIESSLPHEVGSELLVSFMPPGGDGEFVSLALVRHVELFRRGGDHRPSGMGLEFVDLPEAYRDALAADLVGLPPPLPDFAADRCVEIVDPEDEDVMLEPLYRDDDADQLRSAPHRAA